MKKSIGILAGVLLTGSVYSQDYYDTTPHRSASNPELETVRNQQPLEHSTPGRAEFDAQSSLRAQQSLRDQQSEAKQGSTLSDEDASEVVEGETSLSEEDAGEILRGKDDPDLANRNQQLSNPDVVARPGLNADDQDPDMIYEEWILITPPDVGAPGESESGSASSADQDREPAPSYNQSTKSDPHTSFDREIDEASELNATRSYGGYDYWNDAQGGPGSAQSGKVSKDEKLECPYVNKQSEHQGSAQSTQSESRSSTDRENRSHYDHDRSESTESSATHPDL